jgi:hypothetical protein
MTRKLAFTAFVAVAIAYLWVNDRPLTQDRLAHNDQPMRQFIDAKQAQQTPAFIAETYAESGGTSDVEIPPAMTIVPDLAFDTDIPVLNSSFDLAAVDTLMRDGRVSLDLPDGRRSTLHKTQTRTEFGITHLQAEADGYVATITRRGEAFFATLANSSGSYRIEGNATQSRVFPHRLIAQRRLQHETDYRHVHSSF